MARVPPDNYIQTPEIGRRIAQRYRLADPRPVLAVSPELVPVVVVDVISGAEEDEASSRVRSCIGGNLQTAAAAQLWTTQLRNPAASGISVRSIGVLIASTVSQFMDIREHDTALATDILQRGFTNTRIPGTPRADLRYDVPAAALGSLRGIIRITSTGSIWIPLDWFLDEAQGIIIQAQAAAIQCGITWYWTEESLVR